jgi:putative DNA primase/helicase
MLAQKNENTKHKPNMLQQSKKAGAKPVETNIIGPDYSDYSNAQRLVAEYGQDLHYCYPWRKWLVWDGSRWEIDNTLAVMYCAKKTAKKMLDDATESLVNASTEGEKKEARKEIKEATECFSRYKLEAMVVLAQSEPVIPVLPKQLDVDPFLFNVKNGTINLKTGRLQKAQRKDLLTKLSPVIYDPEAKCPLWLSFLDKIFNGNQDLISFVQKIAGYSLTGDVSEQVLFILYGKGANGKSVLMNVLLHVTGDYGKPGAPGLLMVKKHEQHPTEIADLKGARLVTLAESGEGKRLAEDFIKQLTGGDWLKARGMREDFWKFKPSHKIWLATNHKPIIKGNDYAIWRRIRLIPFEVTIPYAEQDKQLTAKLKKESPGIFNWMVKGCLMWQREGLTEPEEVAAATQNYKEEMDTIKDFIEENCLVNPLAKVEVANLYVAYLSWCEENGEYPLSKKNLVAKLEEMDFEKRRVSGNKPYLFGLNLLIHDKASDSSWVVDDIKKKGDLLKGKF